MRKLICALTSIVALALGACSSHDNTIISDGGGPGGAGDVAVLTLLTSSPQMPSDGSADVTISALARDASNNVVPDVQVLFAASSGSLAVPTDARTSDDGIITATLSTAGDPTNRTITVTAQAGDASAAVTVNVIGTTLLVNGPSSLPFGGDPVPYNIVLSTAGGAGIPNALVTVASANGNGISSSPLTTDSTGTAIFNLTANAGGVDTLTATALGLTAQKTVTISQDVFRFTAPLQDTDPDTAGVQVPEIPLNTPQSVTVQWQTGGANVPNGSQVTFTTTRGVLDPVNGVAPTAGGNATINVQASNAGPAVITATNADGASTQLNVEFVATVPDTLELQASPFTLPTNDQSAVSAIVRDPNGNLVKNKIVVFSLTDVTGGFLSVAQAETNSQGRAQTLYNSSSTTSASNGVVITATVQGTGVTDSVNLTVAARELFISLGTGNEIFEPNTAQYRKEWIVQVTDAQGNGVSGVNVALSVLSTRYWEGERAAVDPPGAWLTQPGIEALPAGGCVDEDTNRNGILDIVPDEDLNGSGRLEAGNIATVVTSAGGSVLTTDTNGFGLVSVYWPQEYAYWLEVRLEASTSVQGTEFARASTFMLDGLATDFNNTDNAPPGPVSPFGVDGDCFTWDF